jgi:hypothetical protein
MFISDFREPAKKYRHRPAIALAVACGITLIKSIDEEIDRILSRLAAESDEHVLQLHYIPIDCGSTRFELACLDAVHVTEVNKRFLTQRQ